MTTNPAELLTKGNHFPLIWNRAQFPRYRYQCLETDQRWVSPTGVLGGAHVRRCGGSPHIRFPACTQIRRLPRTHEGPGQRPGGRLWRQWRQQHHHSGDDTKIAPWTHSHLAPYVCEFVYISCKKKLLNLARLFLYHLQCQWGLW